MASRFYRGLEDDAFLGMSQAEKRAHFRRRVWQRLGGVCALCMRDLPFEHLHMDHILPHSAGGSDDWDNIQPTHATCNTSAGPKGYARTLPKPNVFHFLLERDLRDRIEDFQFQHRLPTRTAAMRRLIADGLRLIADGKVRPPAAP